MANNVESQSCNNRCTKRLLLLVDVQYDFINGSLAVEGALSVMDNLAKFIADKPKGTFNIIVMTADYHPYEHSSFKVNGGIWPVHCVQHTHGASIYQPVFETVKNQFPEAVVLTKGEDIAVDEYSIMANKASAKKLLDIIEENGVEEIYVAGLCGDYCVGNSIKDLVEARHGEKIRVLTRFIGNIDDGTTLRKIMTEHNLQDSSL